MSFPSRIILRIAGVPNIISVAGTIPDLSCLGINCWIQQLLAQKLTGL